MPTNRVEPNWCCDVCGKSHGDDYDRAARCETKPVGTRPRVGAVVLRHSYQGPAFHVVTEVGGRPTLGDHDWFFRLSNYHDPLYSGRYWDFGPPGTLAVLGGSFTDHAAMHPFRWGQGWTEAEALHHFARAVGFDVPRPDDDHRGSYGFSPGRVAGPLLPEHRELLDVLELSPDWHCADGTGYRSYRYTAAWIAAGGLGSRAVVEHLARPVTAEALHRAWERWWAGEQITVPLPEFLWKGLKPARYGRAQHLTASGLKKRQRVALDALGLTWPQRTDHKHFIARCLIPEVHLPMENEKTPQFGRPTTAVLSAKGGVGKSTVAAALGVALAETGTRTLIVDCDPRNSSQAAIWEPGRPLVDEERLLLRGAPTGVPGLTVISPGQFLATDERAEWTGQTLRQWLAFVAANTDLADVDRVVLDLPAGGGKLLQDVHAYARPTATETVLVVTGHRLVADATERWAAAHGRWRDHRMPVAMVENLSHLPDGTRVIGTDEATDRLGERLGLECVAHLPIADDHVALAGSAETKRLAEYLGGTVPCPSCDRPRPTDGGVLRSGSVCPHCGHVEPQDQPEDEEWTGDE